MGEKSEEQAEGQGRVVTIMKAFTGIARMISFKLFECNMAS
jgi:hypothetical protein